MTENKTENKIENKDDDSYEENAPDDIDIMSYINKDKLNLINDAFNKLGMGLTLEQFLQIMLHHADIESEKESIDYVEKLIDAFKQIDVNGDETLEWDEFSNYIVETGISKQKNNFVNVIRNYHLSPIIKDKQKHDSEINKLYFFDKIKHLLAIENESKKILVYNYLKGNLITQFVAHNGSVIAAEYCINQNLVVTSGSDNCLMFWNPSQNYNLVNKIPTREIQITLKWYNPLKYLITGGFDQVINIYKNLEFTEFGKLKNSIDLYSMKRLHFEIITDIIVLKKQKLIAASDLHGLITLWYLHNFENKDKLQDPKYGHHRGVTSLVAIEEKNWLLSCGTEHFVMIWDLVVGKHVGMLQGHSQSLIGVKILNGTSQIITGDVSGIIKVWDSRDTSLVQTISIPNNGNKKAHTFAVTNTAKKKLIVGSDKIYFFDYEESQEGNLTDSKLCICVLYNEVFNIFVTAHIDCIKIWDAEKGHLKQVFRNITNAEISCVKFDYRKRKLFIGDVEGHVLLINILNGVQMKYFNKHKDYVSAMAYYSEGKKFISSSWDGFIKIHDDDSPDEKGLQLFELSHNVMGKINSCNTMDFSEEMKILASGYDNGIVTLINMKSLSSEGTLTDHKKVTLVSFLDEYPSIVVCDQTGNIHFWSLILTKPKKLIRDFVIENKSRNESKTKENFPVKCITFEKNSNILFLGDETGYVKAYNISEYINYLKLMLPCCKIEYSDVANLSLDEKLSPELEKLRDDLLKLEKFDQSNDMAPRITITLGDLIKMKNSLNINENYIPVLEKEFIAHKYGVTSVCCHNDPIFFVSAGHDMKVHVWDRNFNKIGSLTTVTDIHWNVNINIKEERKRARKEAREKYYEIKDLDYETLFEGETKLPKLVDDD